MQAKTVSILTVNIDASNPTINIICTTLQDMYWKVEKTKLISQDDSLLLSSEIEKCVKYSEISILIGDYTNQIAKSLSIVFHQNLHNSKVGQVPMYARFLDSPKDNVLYIQGLIVIPVVCNIWKLFENVVLPFLTWFSPGEYTNVVLFNNKHNEIPNIEHMFSTVYSYRKYQHVRKSIESIEKCFNQNRPDNVFISFNGGKDCTVLLHLTLAVLKKNYPKYSKKLVCLYVENVDSFNEINSFIADCEANYSLEIIKVRKNIKEALKEILNDKGYLKACLLGTRRTDPFSEHLETFQMTDSDWPQVMRVSPLLDWHYSQIWDYLLTFKVQYCKLYDVGYTSLGNVNNTVENPLLHYVEDGKETFLPAYKLLDASQERRGRLKQDKKN